MHTNFWIFLRHNLVVYTPDYPQIHSTAHPGLELEIFLSLDSKVLEFYKELCIGTPGYV